MFEFFGIDAGLFFLFLLEVVAIVDFSQSCFDMIEIANFSFLFVGSDLIVIFSHELRFSGLFCEYGFDERNFLIEE